MEVFVARQPIFDRDEKLYAYELLYRSGNVTSSQVDNGDQATAEVMITGFLNIGIEKLSENKKCFINFTENFLLQGIPNLYSPDIVVVEILEDVEPTNDVISAVRELKQKGYTIALDDFILNDKYLSLIEYVDIIKVDFLLSTVEERRDIVDLFKPYGIKFLAEKVETREEFLEAIEVGYDYFQGYFFSKPVILTSNEIPSSFTNYAQLLKEINSPEPNIDKITHYIELDISLTYKLFKLMNSAAFQFKRKVSSINQAIVLLGLNELNKWISVIALKDLSKNSPNENVTLCLTRAKLCEMISKKYGNSKQSSEFFLLGMFSLIDTFLQRPMEDILDDLPLVNDVKEALLGNKNLFYNVYQLTLFIEKGDWEGLAILSEQMDIDTSELFVMYTESIEWSKNIKEGLVN